jgi:zinc transport system ATP-binding protein
MHSSNGHRKTDTHTPAIEVAGLTLSYGGEEILSDLNFTIDSGTITAVIGPNGAGKTTLIKALLGLIPFEKGEVKLFGVPQGTKRCRHLYGHHSGCLHPAYVPQRFTFDKTFPITVREFLELVPPSSRHTIGEVLKEVDMGGSERKLLRHLSGGQLQRVLIARAILHESNLMFLDEPLVGVDIAGTKTFYELIKFLNEKHGTTSVLVSHEIDVVYQYASNVICLNKKLICEGHPREVLDTATLHELYGKDVLMYEHKPR